MRHNCESCECVRARRPEDIQSVCGVLTRCNSCLFLQECQSLIEDNRRLITAADRQARANPSMIAADHQLYHHHQQLQQRPHRHQAQPPSATRVGGVSGGGSSVCTGGCGTTASTVETVVLQTQIDTLQWQLKQVCSHIEFNILHKYRVIFTLLMRIYTPNASAALHAHMHVISSARPGGYGTMRTRTPKRITYIK